MTVYYKMRQTLLQNAIATLLQNTTKVYQNIRLQNATILLQSATVITKCDDFITKCDSYYKCNVYYKIRRYRVLSNHNNRNSKYQH